MKSQNVPVTIYGTDFGIIEVKALLPVTDRIINKWLKGQVYCSLCSLQSSANTRDRIRIQGSNELMSVSAELWCIVFFFS